MHLPYSRTHFFSLCFGLSAPGMRIFFCFRKASPIDEAKPETENTLPVREEDCPSPLPAGWLDASEGKLRFAERIYANTRGRMNGLTASCQKNNKTGTGNFRQPEKAAGNFNREPSPEMYRAAWLSRQDELVQMSN